MSRKINPEDCSDGHLFVADNEEINGGDSHMDVSCHCGEVTGRLVAYGDDFIALEFRHPQDGEPYHLARFILKVQ